MVAFLRFAQAQLSALSPSFVLLSTLFWLFSAFALGTNYFIFQFHGNNYLPCEAALLVGMVLGLICAGSYLLFSHESRCFHGSKQLNSYFFVLVTIAMGTNAIQYTPYSPIDGSLISLEQRLGIDLASVIEWTANHPHFKTILVYAYNSLPYQLSLFPILAILLQGFDEVRAYCVLLLAATLIGFAVYYCWPTLGPASGIDSAHFYTEQRATGIKFNEIHQHKIPSTIDGGMIAFPSFHVIWACLCLHLVRRWRLIFIPALILNLLLIASCVLLGWHYVLDVVGSFFILYVVLKILPTLRKQDG